MSGGERKIGQVRIGGTEAACATCQDCGVQVGYATLNGERVMILRPCRDCRLPRKEPTP